MGLHLGLHGILMLGTLAISCASSVWADSTLLLADPELAANVRLNLAHQAKDEVFSAYFLTKEDRVGLTHLAEMRDAARRGKRAVLLLDSFANFVPKNMLTYLASEGVEIYLYHPFSWKQPLQYLKRLHVKIFVVDGEHLVTGDRNKADEYFGLSDQTYMGRDVYVRGTSAMDARKHVEELITSAEVQRYRGKSLSVSELQIEKEKLDRIDSKKLTRRLRERDDWKKDIIESESAEFLHDKVGEKGASPGLEQELLKAIDRAQHEIVFENAYVVLPPSHKEALKRAAKRGVKIRAITNSRKSTNSPPVGLAWGDSRSFLASIGAEVWEHQGSAESDWLKKEATQRDRFQKLRSYFNPEGSKAIRFQTIHAKTLLIDNRESFIMSYNFDPRSEKLNMETAEHIRGEEFARRLKSEIEKDLKNSGYKLVAANGKLLIPKGEAAASCIMGKMMKIFGSQL